MRWMCLHGRGTNAQIFELQTARIREALGPEHEFIFVNGTVPTDPDVGAAAISDEFYGYISHDVSQDRDLCGGLTEVWHSEGPFDGLMGFSEGGTVSAMMLVEHSRRQSLEGIKCAVFFSSAPPLDPDALQSGATRRLDPVMDGVVVHVPTAHIWSRTVSDEDRNTHRSLADLCDKGSREIYEHELGHDVPGSNLDEGFNGALRAIERIIESARI